VFRSSHGFLVPGYLQIPTRGKSPYPCALLLHGWSGSKDSWYQDFNDISGGNIRKSLLQRGIATVCLDAQCHGHRITLNDFAPVNHCADVDQPVGQRHKGYFTHSLSVKFICRRLSTPVAHWITWKTMTESIPIFLD